MNHSVCNLFCSGFSEIWCYLVNQPVQLVVSRITVIKGGHCVMHFDLYNMTNLLQFALQVKENLLFFCSSCELTFQIPH